MAYACVKKNTVPGTVETIVHTESQQLWLTTVLLLRMLETELEGAKVFEIVALSPSTLHMMISM